MNHPEFSGKQVLVVGGAGFVGSNLSHMLLQSDVKSLIIVDNFMSSERVNVPSDSRVHLITGSNTDYTVLRQIPNEIDYLRHLASYH